MRAGYLRHVATIVAAGIAGAAESDARAEGEDCPAAFSSDVINVEKPCSDARKFVIAKNILATPSYPTHMRNG